MPFQPHYRATARFALGTFGAAVEEASCTLNFSIPAIDLNGEGRQNVANDLFTDWATWIADSNARVSDQVRLEGLKLYKVGTDGKITEDPVEADGTPTPGTLSANRHPWQCSVVMTLVAGVRGKGRFGRIYLPPQCYTMTQDGQITATEHTQMFNATKTLLTNLSNKNNADLGWGLRIAGSTGAEGTLREVTEVRMGRVADTQRRRRRSIPETYSVAEFDA